MIPFQVSLKKKLARASVLALSLASGAAMAATTTTDPFDGFAETVLGWANGSLGTGLAVTMLLVGTGMGIARNSPMPALSGVAGAAFLNWGPDIIQSLTGGALV